MKQYPFYIVDVFANRKYAGNQLGVFVDCDDLTDLEMQTFAQELNFSETTFLLNPQRTKDGFDVRIFTPKEEVPFAGHPTLGTAFIIQQEIIKEKIEKIILNLGVGQIPVNLEYQDEKLVELWMEQKEPNFGKKYKRAEMAEMLSLGEHDIDPRFAPQEVSTGLEFVIVPLKNIKALKKAQVNLLMYREALAVGGPKAILIFAPPEKKENSDLEVRVFADYYGVAEDAATGSANGCLAAYLVANEYWGTKSIDIIVEQGNEIGRPSILKLKATTSGARIKVNVGGKAILIAKGFFI